MSSNDLGANTRALISVSQKYIPIEHSKLQRMLESANRAIECMKVAGLDDPSTWADYADFCELQWLRDELAELLASGVTNRSPPTVPDAAAGVEGQ